jgi:hypothetical protein
MSLIFMRYCDMQGMIYDSRRLVNIAEKNYSDRSLPVSTSLYIICNGYLETLHIYVS